MKAIQVCIGSACHLKGSYDVIHIFQELIKTYDLEEKIELKAAFCTGHCTEAVSVINWDGTVLSLDKNNTRSVFLTQILPYI